MSLTVELKPEVERALADQAAARGLAPNCSTGWTTRYTRGSPDASSGLTSRLPNAGECSMANANCRERLLMLPTA